MALGSTSLKPSMWLRYEDDTFIPSALITIDIAVTVIFHRFFSSLGRSWSLSLFFFFFLLSFNFTLLPARTAKFTIW